ncbi:lysosome-associated membrane glycoprotein 2 isoform X1 [Poeciliopsis prolifica]|uniref:lysosome-associated membrane glycoprotein 2-like isoform X1 n=1 Tax=Poeciliopsis prolifica TaxID=188132 RepID=UPI0024135D9B|nr:lysosome-associated membrane glycoprotein 2-like isoform X1 [Poeciliopsis prolifica]XP_054887224.1 lysosome-associated membrane glycoprotein 2 isoform X1 [Poeciliopsis prolifica]
MARCAAFIFLLSFGVVSHLSHGIEVQVKNEDKLCLYANLTVSFSVTYEVAVNKKKTVSFGLPTSALSNESKCDKTSSVLKLSFADGHSWSVTFSLKDKSYQADAITFVYNLNDSNVFPDSSSKDTVTVKAKPDIKDVGVNMCYLCKSKDTIIASPQANMTLSDVLIQAFVINGTKSKNQTVCPADKPAPTTPTPTTVAPTTNATTVAPTTNATTVAPTTNATTVAPTTNTTTVAPATNATTAAPPTTPTPTLPTPTVGNYSIKHDANSTACLLANFGLRIGFTQNKKYQEVNFDPATEVSGSCGVDNSELTLVSNNITVSLSFYNDTKKFRLHALNVTINTSSGVFAQSSTNLSLWEAAVGSSYMCNKEQNFTITDLLSIYTFSLHVQPFGVKKGLYSTAEECFLDSDLSFLVPIAVGVALSFLIILVLISYLIGRRKSRTGYQSV